jgi:hypothetical protein
MLNGVILEELLIYRQPITAIKRHSPAAGARQGNIANAQTVTKFSLKLNQTIT